MKRFLSILLAVVMVMSLAVPAFASRFSDTKDSDYANAIEHLAGLGVIAGYEDGTFKPEKVVTRAEIAKMLVVCLGLEAGASLLEGTSEFDDVPATHWATGYIAVAAQYGLIKGDGDGNFRPDDTVNISEAATMVLRALGYNRVVDKAGEWPTNYLNKSNELDIFEDVGNFKGTDGATRGIIAQMMWNMLNTEMWDVLEESEGDGLAYGAEDGNTMLFAKFPKYTFVESMLFVDYDIVEDKNNNPEVILNFKDIVSKEEVDDKLIYAGNDFYTFVPGTEFEGLVFEGKDGDEVVTLFATEENHLVEGFVKDLAEDFDIFENEFSGDYTYIYANMEGTKASSGLKFEKISESTFNSFVAYGASDSWYVEDLEETKDGFTVIESTGFSEDTDYKAEFDEDDTYLVLKDGERVTRDEIKVGDVLTFVHYSNEENHYDVVIITRDNTAEGTVTKYVADTNMLTLGGEKYYVSGYATFIVDEEDEDSESDVWDDAENDFTDYKDEDARVYLDMFGNVIRVAFGELSEKVSNGAFFVVANDAWMVSNEDGAEYKIKLTDMNGTTKTYTFDEDVDGYGADLNDDDVVDGEDLNKNDLLWVEFDDELIAAFATVARIDGNNLPLNEENKEFKANIIVNLDDTYGDGKLTDLDFNEKDEDNFNFIKADAVDFEENKLYWTNDFDEEDPSYSPNHYVKITNSTKLVKIITEYDEDEDEIIYSVEIETGKDAFKGIAGLAGIATTGEFLNTEYVFTWEDNTTTDFMYGIVDSIEEDEVNEETTVVLIGENGKEEEFVISNPEDTKEGSLIAYRLNAKDEVVVEESANPDDFRRAAEVTSVDDDKRTAMIEHYEIIDLDDEEFQEDSGFDEDTVVVIGKVGLDKNDELEFTGFEVISYDDYKFAEKDFIGLAKDLSNNIVAVYRLTSAVYNAYDK